MTGERWDADPTVTCSRHGGGSSETEQDVCQQRCGTGVWGFFTAFHH